MFFPSKKICNGNQEKEGSLQKNNNHNRNLTLQLNIHTSKIRYISMLDGITSIPTSETLQNLQLPTFHHAFTGHF